jgi:hypothetical protein
VIPVSQADETNETMDDITLKNTAVTSVAIGSPADPSF